MKNIGLTIYFILFISYVFSSMCTQNDTPLLKCPYLGQKPPGMTPVVFAQGIVSTEKDEINSIFSPDGKEFFFSRDTYRNTSRAGKDYAIMYMRLEKTGWTKPKVPSFSANCMCGDMFMSSDGQRLYYCSDRPLAGKNTPKNDADIWMVERTSTGWTEPVNLGNLINSERNEWYPSLTNHGTLYYSSGRENGYGGQDIYYSNYLDGKFICL